MPSAMPLTRKTSHGLIILNRPERLRARALSLVQVIGFPGRLPFNTKKKRAQLCGYTLFLSSGLIKTNYWLLKQYPSCS